MKPDNKKPFGLQIAARNAAKALKEGKVPASNVLYQLLALQKEVYFPRDLDSSYFENLLKPSYITAISDNDKRVVARTLDEIKKPQVDIALLLEGIVYDGWVHKKSPQEPKKLSRNILAPGYKYNPTNHSGSHNTNHNNNHNNNASHDASASKAHPKDNEKNRSHRDNKEASQFGKKKPGAKSGENTTHRSLGNKKTDEPKKAPTIIIKKNRLAI